MRLHELTIENHLQFIKKRWHYREAVKEMQLSRLLRSLSIYPIISSRPASVIKQWGASGGRGLPAGGRSRGLRAIPFNRMRCALT